MSTFQKATGKSISQSFEQYCKDNPDVYPHFVHFALQWLKTGAKKISSKQIVGRIRWHVEIETKGESAKVFKINDAFSSRLARKFTEDYPEYTEKFNFRELRSQ